MAASQTRAEGAMTEALPKPTGEFSWDAETHECVGTSLDAWDART